MEDPQVLIHVQPIFHSYCNLVSPASDFEILVLMARALSLIDICESHVRTAYQ